MKGVLSLVFAVIYMGSALAVLFHKWEPSAHDIAVTTLIAGAIAWLSLSKLERMER